MTKKNGNADYLVVFGIGADDKPHAARFKTTDEAIACKAAELMWFRVGRAKDETALKLVRKLPQGRVFASGKALVPLVKLELYDKLLEVLDFDPHGPVHKKSAELPASDSPVPEPVTAPQSDPWETIGVGSVVLAFEEDKDGAGWWEAVVIAVSKDGNTLSLRWRDWPDARKVSRARHKVGLLAPVA